METEAYAAFTPILDKGGVDVLFCGHVRTRRASLHCVHLGGSLTP